MSQKARIHSIKSISFALVVWGVLTGGVCEMVPRSDPISKEDLYGGYKANFETGREDSLYLFPDSLWVRKYISGSGRLYVDSGKWALEYLSKRDSSTRHMKLRLHDFISRFDVDSADDKSPLEGAMNMRGDTPVDRPIVIWRDGERVRLGSVYGPAWMKK